MKKKIILCAALLAAVSFGEKGTHTVVEEDNLWNISGDYLGDPYQWERLWNANSYIENPDLIYPGDEIRIPGRSVDSETGSETVYKASSLEGNSVQTFDDKVAGLAKNNSSSGKKEKVEPSYTPVRTPIEQYFASRSGLFSVERRRSAPYVLNTTGTADNEFALGIAQIEDDSRQIFGLNTIVTIVVDPGKSVSVGETYDISQVVKEVDHRDKKVSVVEPVGAGIITTVMGDSARLRITEAWDIIRTEARIEPVRTFAQLGEAKVVKDVNPVEVNMLSRIDGGVAIKPYEIVILDAGEDVGLKTGDLMEGYFVHPKEGTEHEPCLRGIVITVDENSAALIFHEVYKHVRDGDYTFARYGKLQF